MTKRSLIIGIDIDETLAASAPDFISYSNRTYGTSLDVSDYSENWAGMWGVDFDELNKRAEQYYRSGVMLKHKPIDESREILARLKDEHNLIAITARPDICKSDTCLWIDRHFSEIIDKNKLYFTGAWNNADEKSLHHTKGDMCESLGVDLLIDDQLKHCIGAAEKGITALLFGDYSWNKALELPENVYRVSSWSEVLDFINEKYK